MKQYLFKICASCLLICLTSGLISQTKSKAIPVKIDQRNGGYSLIRNGQPYFVKGAGGTSNMEKLASYGGNSVRTWETRNAIAILDKAHSLGLTESEVVDVMQ